MVSMSGYSWQEEWLLGTYALFVLAGVCWLPVVWMQIQMAKIAAVCKNELPQKYWQYACIWERLGIIAFTAMLIVFGLMVFKPNT